MQHSIRSTAGGPTPTFYSDVVNSGEELVAFDGQAMLDPGDPQFEVLIGASGSACPIDMPQNSNSSSGAPTNSRTDSWCTDQNSWAQVSSPTRR